MTSVRATVHDFRTGSHDVVIGFEEASTGADLQTALDRLGLRQDQPIIDGSPLPSAQPLAEQPLVHGSRIEFGSSSPLPEPQDGPNLVVVSGPAAGAWHPIRTGAGVVIGRADSDLSLPSDLLLSRAHARFDFDGETVTVTDLESANGTSIEGTQIHEPTVVPSGAYVQVGSSTVAVVQLERGDRARLGAPLNGTYPFPRTFRVAQSELPKELRLPRAPQKPDASGSTWWRALLPLVSGIGFAIVTKNFLFLLISALAPLVYAGDAWRKKKRHTNESAAEQAQYEADVASTRTSLAQTAREERRRARVTNPMGGTANLFAIVRHRSLWERRPADVDFLSVTVGLAERPSHVALYEPTADTPAKTTLPMWGVPVNVNLAATGSVAVIGDRDRARAVVRSLLMGLGVTHSPSDVKVWLFASDQSSAEWAPIRWLPHVMNEDGTCRIAATLQDRGAMLASIRQIIDGRSETRRSSNDPLPVPVHVVIVDGTDLLSAGDVTEILVRGGAVGVIGIVADPTVAPDGVMGTLTLGAAADSATFESRLEPLIEGVLTAEMPTRWAEDGARRLAALQPATSGRSELSSSSERLAAMLGSEAMTPGALADRWRKIGPSTRVLVGTTADAPFSMDVMRDGPHGLVGGMTRSGKTEFLKTLITSLAWANHPDDLSFVIVDFKGGIDYTVAGRLPHVLAVSSNQDLSGFERTLQLLSAEQRRRQTIFGPLEVSNLDAYREKRLNRPDLPVIPRLIVLIDEFGELLSSEEGRDQLKRIESMSRIGAGLGVNLLLITQNFEGQLPPQIAANAGLRVCFRVQAPENSKVVLDSGIASTIPSAAKGRGYARLQGKDPIEFQSARVAGRRPELVGRGVGGVTARLQPFETLAQAVESSDAVDVPADETDMSAMIDTIVAATKISGWTRPAVPWPTVLPADIPLAEVLPASSDQEVAIGTADVPEHQRQLKFSLRWSDEHLALVGGPRADLNTLLVTIACSAAATYSPDDLHIYGIDFTGRGLARIAQLPHCGGLASRNDSLAVRISQSLLDEVAYRRSELAMEGVSTLEEFEERTGRTFPHILLLIAGAEKLSAITSSDDPSAAAVPLTTLLAEGSGLGVQVICGALPNFLSYRPGSYIDRRILFEAADMSEYVPLGCPRPLLGEIRGARRGVDTASRLTVQFCSLSGGEMNEADVLDAFVARLRDDLAGTRRVRPPKRIAEVSWPARLFQIADALQDPPRHLRQPLVLGVESRTGDPLWADAVDLAGSLFVAGGKQSGRSNALIVLGLLARHLGWQVAGTATVLSSPLATDGIPFSCLALDEIDAWVGATTGPRLVVIDDIHRVADEAVLPTRLAEVDLVAVSGTAQYFVTAQRALVNMGAKHAKNGMILVPEVQSEVTELGIKPDLVAVGPTAGRRAGQGVLLHLGDVSEIIVPRFEEGR